VAKIENKSTIDEGRTNKSKTFEKNITIGLFGSTLPEKALTNTSRLLFVFMIWFEQYSPPSKFLVDESDE